MTLKDKQIIYRQVFGNPVGKEVLTDLANFCHAMKTTSGRPEDIQRLEGRREVFLQIMTILKIDIEEMYDEYLDGDF